MKFKLLSPFCSSGFSIRSEALIYDPNGYVAFWDAVEEAYHSGNGKESSGRLLSNVYFAHADRYAEPSGSRYRTIDSDSLIRPLHILEVYPDPAALDMARLFEKSIRTSERTPPEREGDGEQTNQKGPVEGGSAGQGAAYSRSAMTNERPLGGTEKADSGRSQDASMGTAFQCTPDDLLATLAERIRAHPPSVLIRVYNYNVSILEIDLPLDGLLFQLSAEEREDVLGSVLDRLQQAGVEFAEDLIKVCQEKTLSPLFAWLGDARPNAARYIQSRSDSRGETGDSSMLAGAVQGEEERSPVLWVTRTLLFEQDDTSFDTDAREAIIRHWLKDVSDSTKRNELEKTVNEPTGYSIRWLNYLFRENSYSSTYPEHGWTNGKNGLARPFCWPWEAMINAQYYYAACDILQTMIHRVLARSFADRDTSELRRFKGELDDIVKESNLVVLEFEENFKFYRRSVAAKMREILGSWAFQRVVLKQLERGIQVCNERVTELHNRAAARSSLYTDLILLSIGVTSVFSILLTLVDYGRKLAGDPSQVAYERGSFFKIVDWVAAHSTDGILFIGAIISAGLVFLYFHFKRQQLL